MGQAVSLLLIPGASIVFDLCNNSRWVSQAEFELDWAPKCNLKSMAGAALKPPSFCVVFWILEFHMGNYIGVICYIQ